MYISWVSLAAVNLNHLVALDALLAERSVGRAAARLGITQSAMSHTLRSLRELTGDPLLVRTRNAMMLTPFAEQAKGRLQRGLSDLESVVSGRAAFDPSTIGDMFTLATHDGVAAMLAAPLRAELKRRAPSAKLRIQPAESSALTSSLESGDVDVLALPPVLDLDGLEHEQMPDSPKLRSFSREVRSARQDLDPRCRVAAPRAGLDDLEPRRGCLRRGHVEGAPGAQALLHEVGGQARHPRHDRAAAARDGRVGEGSRPGHDRRVKLHPALDHRPLRAVP